MLHLLRNLRGKLKINLSVAHLDHQIRGEEARREAAFVSGLCRALGIPCISKARDVPGFKAETGMSLQEAAREMRYAFFREALAETGANRLALAHQADDQAETVLMRLFRGASLKGLAGIPPCRDGYIIRPLIEAGRGELEAWLGERGLAFVPDSSAGEQQYLRNKIRHQLLPLLKQGYNPGVVETLGRTAALLRQDEEALEALVSGILSDSAPPRESHSVEISSLQSAGRHLYGRIIRQIIARIKGDTRALTLRHIQAVIRLIDTPGPARTVQLPGGWVVRRQYGSLTFARRRAPQPAFYYEREDIPEFIDIRETGSRLCFEFVPVADLRAVLENDDPRVAFLSLEKALGPVVVRSCNPGDAFQPLGAPGRKKLADFFIDSKIPPAERRRVPVLLFGDRIAWVCGLRIDDAFKLGHEQPQALKAMLLPSGQI